MKKRWCLVGALVCLGCDADGEAAAGQSEAGAVDAALDAAADAAGGGGGGPASDGGTADAGASPQGSNSNACLARLGAMQPVCPTADAVALPTAECCEAFRAFQEDACGCSPFVAAVVGESAGGAPLIDRLVGGLTAVCPTLGVALPELDCDAATAPSGIATGVQATYQGGTCGVGDAELDARRFRTILAFSALFEAAETAACVDTPALIQDLEALGTPELAVEVPYGIGTYKGYEDAAEYLSIAFKGSNHGFWVGRFLEIDPNERAFLEVSADGGTWVQGATTPGAFFNEALPYAGVYSEQQVTFPGCEDRIEHYTVRPTDGMRTLVEHFVWGASLFKRWGVEDICRYHTRYCADDPETRQYASEAECLDFMRTLPLYSAGCGPNRPLAGLSLPCKFKHHFMVPANPALHCPHIGPPGQHDPHDKLKCDDEAECSDPDQAAGWPDVVRIGDQTPDAVRALAEASNAGFEDEPLGCVLPTHPE
ncbi:MAG: hypothetical protein KC613_17705 [Myxococcales bacterium]|nr:hypothetical protein [Myxococcales bacterium]